jgi:two-component system OmpR family sensor kinase
MVAAVLAVVTAVLTCAGILAVHVVRGRLVDRIDDELRASAVGAVQTTRILDPEQLSALGSAPPLNPRAQAVLAIGPRGVGYSSPSGSAEHPDPLPDATQLGLDELDRRAGEPFGVDSAPRGVRYRALAIQLRPGGGSVVFATPLTTVEGTIHDLVRILVLAFAVTVLAVAFLTWVVGRITIKPLEDMIDTAQAIGAGDLARRVATDQPHADGRRLAGAINAMFAQIEDAFAARDRSDARLRRFVSDASHELRTPLTTIRGYAELHRRGGVDPGDLDRVVGRIESEATRMTGLVEDLLLLARIDQGRTVEREVVDLAPIVTDAVADARAVEPDRAITLDVASTPVLVAGDAWRLHQVLGNLLDNVRVHTPPSAAVHVTLAADAGTATIVVADDGPGMAADDARHAFDRFYRSETSRSRATGGTGLGLAIVASVVESHDGTVAVDSTPGGGSAFTVRLPVAADGPAPVPAADAPPVALVATPAAGGRATP